MLTDASCLAFWFSFCFCSDIFQWYVPTFGIFCFQPKHYGVSQKRRAPPAGCYFIRPLQLPKKLKGRNLTLKLCLCIFDHFSGAPVTFYKTNGKRQKMNLTVIIKTKQKNKIILLHVPFKVPLLSFCCLEIKKTLWQCFWL